MNTISKVVAILAFVAYAVMLAFVLAPILYAAALFGSVLLIAVFAIFKKVGKNKTATS